MDSQPATGHWAVDMDLYLARSRFFRYLFLQLQRSIGGVPDGLSVPLSRVCACVVCVCAAVVDPFSHRHHSSSPARHAAAASAAGRGGTGQNPRLRPFQTPINGKPSVQLGGGRICSLANRVMNAAVMHSLRAEGDTTGRAFHHVRPTHVFRLRLVVSERGAWFLTFSRPHESTVSLGREIL
jgi:hypothetical protein